MRHKKHLDERLENCADVLIARESENFYRVPVTERNFTVNLTEHFGNANEIVLEIGCGKGGWVTANAKLHPEKNYVAVEKLSNVIVVACEQALEYNLPNLKFINCGAENLLCFLPEKSVNEIVLNFSCPFPKKTYANRRLTHRSFLEKYKRLLKDGGLIFQKTDDAAFFEYSLEQYLQCGFSVREITRDLHASSRENVPTEYEIKFAAQGKKICACIAQIDKKQK
ncbi:MAG: tRNA (guanosine(46)-N7)-methyltransferase TrmB [Corallococcus sp.]|nr:tRNA (guanosine(46)-N7)-methyltransferase TrmB [Corallococcus sp.]MCM1360152.1 tRNA (guanosine(46)-N7)-methyltransferase TrmB [Corallococcus sp.]MCM1395749.1 tRNA (guanosine(46)-N7)-methyltransferase TrmB [Corallococcus sp.]